MKNSSFRGINKKRHVEWEDTAFDKRKSFVEPVEMSGSNFRNETLFLFFCGYHYHQKWGEMTLSYPKSNGLWRHRFVLSAVRNKLIKLNNRISVGTRKESASLAKSCGYSEYILAGSDWNSRWRPRLGEFHIGGLEIGIISWNNFINVN